jgi:hypothetical protein
VGAEDGEQTRGEVTRSFIAKGLAVLWAERVHQPLAGGFGCRRVVDDAVYVVFFIYYV